VTAVTSGGDCLAACGLQKNNELQADAHLITWRTAEMHQKTRRSFIIESSIMTSTLLLPASAFAFQEKKEGEQAEVTPTEDLMREHGLLNRVLLIYEESERRLSAKGDLDPKVLADSAGIIKNFIENYHEKLEEDYLFPRFEKAGKLTDLVSVLRQQHRAGRQLTSQIQQLATAPALKNASDRQKLVGAIAAFVRMYRPHEAREDTVLFPALHQIVSAHEFDALGDEFENKEHQLFGKAGFEGMVERVAGLEKQLGIYELAKFTPK
jgi:hemerythrin-like domain-containing protein